mgnify:CR=1 FL=1
MKGLQIVQDLVLLTCDNGDFIRCKSLDDALEKAISLKETEGRIRVEVTPEGGGRMTILDFDRASLDWIAATSTDENHS